MSGIQEVTKEYLNRIENILQNKPDYMRSFTNYLTDNSIRTRYNYLNYMCTFIDFVKKQPEELVFDDFNNYMNHVSYKANGQLKSSSYRIAVYSALKRFCEYLYVSKRISVNYMLDIKKPKSIESQVTIKKREKGYLTEEEIKEYIDNIDTYRETHRIRHSKEWDIRDKAIIVMFLTTGIRNSALRMLDVSDIDLDKKTMMVTDKGEKVKTYNLSKKLCKILSEWLECREKIKNEIIN